ncbi:MAG: hypothetical protein JNM20_06705 [Rhizobiales bacterium]|nr:hypothetical protein [Hyphomicrobiales bacterium]
MIRLTMLLLAILLCGPAFAADCPLSRIEQALNASLDKMKPLEREVSDVQSTEGGTWRIYREKDGRVNTITRGDYGESGRGELRLSIVNRNTYGIAKTRIDYIRHAFLEDQGPFAFHKVTTEYFFYCDGKLYLPGVTGATMDLDQYKKDGDEALAAFLSAKDVADFTKGLKR